jgi:hypothetical protein
MLKETKSSVRATWTEDQVKLLVVLLIEQTQAGKGGDGNFKKAGWTAIQTAFNNKLRISYNIQQLKQRWALVSPNNIDYIILYHVFSKINFFTA